MLVTSSPPLFVNPPNLPTIERHSLPPKAGPTPASLNKRAPRPPAERFIWFYFLCAEPPPRAIMPSPPPTGTPSPLGRA